MDGAPHFEGEARGRRALPRSQFHDCHAPAALLGGAEAEMPDGGVLAEEVVDGLV